MGKCTSRHPFFYGGLHFFTQDDLNLLISSLFFPFIGALHDPISWYGINFTGMQITQWDFQNKGRSGWTGTSSFVLEVPLRNLRPSVIYSASCDRIVQRAH